MKIPKCRNILFLIAYTIWMVRVFFNTTYFYTAPMFVTFKEYAFDAVLLICLFCIVLDFEVKIREIVLLFAVCFFYCICRANGAVSFSGAFVLIYAARKVEFEKIAKWTCVLMGALFCFVVGASFLGVIENHVFIQEAGRTRYGLGFVYCSYASHYLLLFFMLYFVLRKRIRWYEVLLLIAANVLGFMATDTKTDMISLVLMLATMLILHMFREKKRWRNVFSGVVFLLPFLFWGISIYTAKKFTWLSEDWASLNQMLNGRLDLGNKALAEYPLRLFGQKISWVGGSAMIKNPTKVYNYVDNNYLAVTLQMGVLFAFFMCLVYARAACLAIQKNQIAIAAGLIVFMVVGLVNPEMRNLLYNTFVLVLLKSAKDFEGAKKRNDAKMGESKLSAGDRAR